jgi:hypothetical protein
VGWAERRPDIQAPVLLGSQARRDHLADQWSDLDLALVTDQPDRYLAGTGWLTSSAAPAPLRPARRPGGPGPAPGPLRLGDRRRLHRGGGLPGSGRRRGRMGPGGAPGPGQGLRRPGRQGRAARYPERGPAPRAGPACAPRPGGLRPPRPRVLVPNRLGGQEAPAGRGLGGPVHLQLPPGQADRRASRRLGAGEGPGAATWHEGRFMEQWAPPGLANRLHAAAYAEAAEGPASWRPGRPCSAGRGASTTKRPAR